MANNLRVFNTNSEYQSADLVHPAVSYVIETDKVIYDYTPPTPVFQGKWKATYSNGNVTSAECGSSSEIVNGEITASSLVSAEIGDCVTSIGERAFHYYNSLTSIVIPDSVTSIGDNAFNLCESLTRLNSDVDGVFNIPDSVTSIGNGAFYGCTMLTSIVMPNSVTSIGWNTFAYCSSLTSIDIPSGVTSIGDGAFTFCSSLTSIDIPSGVTSIGWNTFAYCSSLTSCTIGSGVTSIGDGAFFQCVSLTSITVNAVTPPILIGNLVFESTNNCPIYVPSASVNAYKAEEDWGPYYDRIQPIP